MQVFSWLNCQVTNVSFGFFAVSYRKSFYFSLSQSIREQHRSFSHESAAFDIHLPIPNSSVRFAENKKDPSLGGAVNCVFLSQLAEANVSLHKYWLSFPLCTQGVMAVTIV